MGLSKLFSLEGTIRQTHQSVSSPNKPATEETSLDSGSIAASFSSNSFLVP